MTLASTLHSQLGWPQVVLHDAVVLMDRVMQTGPHFNVVSSRASCREAEDVLAEWITLPKAPVPRVVCFHSSRGMDCKLHIVQGM